MAEQRVQRRLAAILAADVVGYSRLVERDEEGTRARLRRLLDECFVPLVASCAGRVVKTMGDGVLAEFASAVDAVRSALAIQDAVADAQAGIVPDDRITLRIGINVGDVIVEGEDIHGDGVNLAARLEVMCEPGRIFVSGSVFEQVASKLEAAFDDLGAKPVKNIARPVRVYRVRRSAKTAGPHPTATSAPALPSKPSIAVLPFENLSSDPEQDYFSDGITEDIIAALSRVRQFFVIARNTTFTYKGKAVDVKAVATALGVRYVLEGSVRRAGNRMRVSVQLVNGVTGAQLWAERYDRELADVFEIQDDITRTVVGAIAPELNRAEQERARLMPTENLDAWDLYQRGQWHLNRIDQDGLAESEALFRNAIALDPNLCCAHAALATVHFYAFILSATSHQGRIAAASEAARRAVEIDSNDPAALVALGRAVHLAGNHADAITYLQSAVALDPSHAQGHYILAAALTFSGRAEDGIAHFETAMRLSPRDPWTAHFMSRLSEAHLYAGHLEEAVHWGQEARKQPGPSAWTARLGLAAALGHLGRADEARAAVDEMRKKLPEVSLSLVHERFSIVHAPYREALLDGLRKASLPA